MNKIHSDEFVKQLFDRMGPTYSITNVITSFGFSELWRWTCVKAVNISKGDTVCDMMAGSGECWRYIPRTADKIISVDFSEFMSSRQKLRRNKSNRHIEVLCEDALSSSIEAESVDHIVSAFGLKTLSNESIALFGKECARLLKPGGSFSFLEISVPQHVWLRPFYLGYLSGVIPVLGKLLLGDIDCYRMLGRYTIEFGSCEPVAEVFQSAGFEVEVRRHFFGCATSLVGTRL